MPRASLYRPLDRSETAPGFPARRPRAADDCCADDGDCTWDDDGDDDGDDGDDDTWDEGPAVAARGGLARSPAA